MHGNSGIILYILYQLIGPKPDDTKTLPEPVLTYHQWGPVIFTEY